MRETSCCLFWRIFQSDVIEAFNSTSRYLDDLLNIDKNFFYSMVNHIYPPEFNTRNKVLTAKHLKQAFRFHKLRKAFSKFYRRHFDIVSK